jgi:hypothetical protein
MKHNSMTSEIKIPLRALNESMIKDLKEKYPEAERPYLRRITLYSIGSI